MDVYVSVNTGNSSIWKKITSMFVSSGGVWKQVTSGYVSSSSVWKKFFSSTPSPSIELPVTISIDNAMYPSTLTGTNFYWTDSTSLTYVFQKSSDDTNWTNIGSATFIANPSSGSSNTVTYALTIPDMPAYTSYYRFVVTALNSTYSTSTISKSTSVSVNQPAPINSVAPTITPITGTVGVTQYSVNSNGTWDPVDADGTYDYLWQYRDQPNTYFAAPGTNNLSTYTPPLNFLTLGYASPIRCRVTATNASGSTPAFSNTAVVAAAVPTGGTVTLTPSGTQYSGTLLTATTSGWSGSPTSYSVRIYGSTFDPPDTSNVVKASSSTASATYPITNGDASTPPLYFKAFATATNGSGISSEVESNVVLSKLPSASALATSDTTITPAAPSSITVANTAANNEGKVTWVNDSNASTSWVSSVTPGSSFTGTDAGSLLTSQVFTITSSATAVATVNNKNNNRKVTVSWNQDGALSYSASVTISGSSFPINGTSNVTGSTSGSSGSFVVSLSTGGGTVRVNSITVYTKASQTGGSFTFTPTTAPSTTPTDKTSSATGSGSVYRAPANSVAPTLNTTSGTAGTTTFSVSNNGTWNPDDADGVYTYQWQYLAGNPQNLSAAAEVARGSTSSSYSPPSDYVASYGSSLRCRVTATNLGGSTDAFSNVATVSAPLPSPPTIISSSATTTSITLNFTLGANSTVTRAYLNGSFDGSTATTSYTFSGLTIGTSYTLALYGYDGTNLSTTSAGGSYSTSSTAPGRVTGVTATVTSLNKPYNQGEIGLSWTAPASNGSAITGYLVEYSSNAGTSWSTLSSNWTSGTSLGSSPWGIATYIFRVSAINAIGTGTASLSSNNAVVTTVPQAPTIGTATPGAGSMSVSFTAGATGGSAITGYTVTSSSGNTGTGTSSPISVSDTGGIARTYTVTATNANGTSDASSSVSGTPSAAATVPGLVTLLTSTSALSGSNLNWSASWSAPSSNGGAAIDGYRVYVERAGSSSGPWIASTTQIPAGLGAYTAGSPAFITSTSVSGRVTGTATTWIRVWVAAVNTVGTGTYTSAVG